MVGQNRKTIVAAIAVVAILLFIVFVPVLYSDHPCLNTYGSVSWRIFEFGGVYVAGWSGNPAGLAQGDFCSPPAHFIPSYDLNW
jgi:hypothetical protein